MGWIIWILLLSAVSAAVAIAGLAGLFRSKSGIEAVGEPDRFGRVDTRKTYRVHRSGPVLGAIGGWLLVAVLSTGFSSYQQIEAGHVGVIREFGAIRGNLDEGPHFIRPWRSVNSVNIRTQSTFFGTVEEDGELVQFPILSAASIETQDLFISTVVSWRVRADSVDRLIREHGTNWESVIGFEARINRAIKETTTAYEAVDVPAKRGEIGNIAREKLAADLDRFFIDVDAVSIANIGFSETFNDAIERKQQATQDALAAGERVREAEFNAESAVATAQGVANSSVVAAEGNAQVIKLNADAQAEANITIAQSLTPDLIRFRALDALPGTTVFLPADGTINLLDIAAALGSEPSQPNE